MPKYKISSDKSNISSITTFLTCTSILVCYKDFRDCDISGDNVVDFIEQQHKKGFIDLENYLAIKNDFSDLFLKASPSKQEFKTKFDEEMEIIEKEYKKIDLSAGTLSDIADPSITSKHFVSIYHRTNANINLIQEDGLKSKKKLYEEKISVLDKNSFLNQPQYIYFQPILDKNLHHFQLDNLIAIKVDPAHVSVFNREYRVNHSKETETERLMNYNKSKVSLAQYLECLAIAERMKQTCQSGQIVLLNPHTAYPFYADSTDSRVLDSRYFYLPEIIIAADYIPANKLIFSKQNPSNPTTLPQISNRLYASNREKTVSYGAVRFFGKKVSSATVQPASIPFGMTNLINISTLGLLTPYNIE